MERTDNVTEMGDDTPITCLFCNGNYEKGHGCDAHKIIKESLFVKALTEHTATLTAELAELKADRELYYNLAYERANEIVGLKQDIFNRDEANRVMVGEVGKLKKEKAELEADREMLDFIEQKIDMILRPVPANKSSKGWMVSGLGYEDESVFGKTFREAITKARLDQQD